MGSGAQCCPLAGMLPSCTSAGSTHVTTEQHGHTKGSVESNDIVGWE